MTVLADARYADGFGQVLFRIKGDTSPGGQSLNAKDAEAIVLGIESPGILFLALYNPGEALRAGGGFLHFYPIPLPDTATSEDFRQGYLRFHVPNPEDLGTMTNVTLARGRSSLPENVVSISDMRAERLLRPIMEAIAAAAQCGERGKIFECTIP